MQGVACQRPTSVGSPSEKDSFRIQIAQVLFWYRRCAL